MNWYTVFLFFTALYSLFGLYKGYYQTRIKKNPFGLCRILNPLGAFVWADAIIFGIFFFFASVVSLILQDVVLFLLIYSVFWVVRSVGEHIYWFLEQFSEKHRNPPHTLWLSKLFPGGSTWIAMQISWQCISVISIILSVYLFVLWLK